MIKIKVPNKKIVVHCKTPGGKEESKEEFPFL